MRQNYSILVISDMHMPYHHPDTVKFLAAIKDKYQPDRVVCIGDEVDWHSISFHEKSPALLSPSNELLRAIECLQPIYKLFPVMDLIESNHGSLVYRKAKHAGLPLEVIKSYRDILQAPPTWKWHFDLTVRMNNDRHVYFHHGQTGSAGALSRKMSMCAVQGHYHNRFHVTYWSNPNGLYWDMHIGCLADFRDHPAFAYGKNHYNNPINGVGIIKHGHALLVPMVMNRKNRWIGSLP